MPHIDLYSVYGLDRRQPSEQLAAALTAQLNAVDPRDQLTRSRIETARAILGDPQRRAAYDRQLDDPQAPPITETTLAALAGRPVPTGPRSGGLAAAFASRQVQVLAGVAGLLVVVLVIVIVAVTSGGGDDGTSAAGPAATSVNAAKNKGGPAADGCGKEFGWSAYGFKYTDQSIADRGIAAPGGEDISGPNKYLYPNGHFQTATEATVIRVSVPGGECEVPTQAFPNDSKAGSVAAGIRDGKSVAVRGYYTVTPGAGTTPESVTYHIDVFDLAGKKLVDKDFAYPSDLVDAGDSYTANKLLAYNDGIVSLYAKTGEGSTVVAFNTGTGAVQRLSQPHTASPAASYVDLSSPEVHDDKGVPYLAVTVVGDNSRRAALMNLRDGSIQQLPGIASDTVSVYESSAGLVLVGVAEQDKEHVQAFRWTADGGLSAPFVTVADDDVALPIIRSVNGYLTVTCRYCGIAVTEIATGKSVYTMTADQVSKLSIGTLVTSDDKGLYTWSKHVPYRLDIGTGKQERATSVPVATIDGTRTVWAVGNGSDGWTGDDESLFALP